MLSPDDPLTPWVLTAALMALVAVLVLRAIRRERHEYARFKRLRSTQRRQATLRKWVIQSLVVFGSSSIVLLALAWPFAGALLDEINEWTWIQDARHAVTASLLWPLITAAALAALLVVSVLGLRAASKEQEIAAIGDVHALLPRNRAELRWGAALSVNAGVVEEALFRLAVPAALFGATGSALAAVVVSLVLFAVLHLYQGVPGMLGSLIAGVLFFAVYVASSSIVVAMIVHALFDLRSLVLIPMVVFGVHKK